MFTPMFYGGVATGLIVYYLWFDCDCPPCPKQYGTVIKGREPFGR